MKRYATDVLIIGSGFGAAAPALRLANAGLRITMIEKGPMVDPATDLMQTQDPKHYLKYIKSCSSGPLSFTYAEGYGGGSAFYEMVTLRAPSPAFRQRDRYGRYLWPGGVNRQTLDPYYERAERMLNVHQIAVEDVPKTGAVFSLLMNNLGYSCDRARYGVRDCVGAAYCISGCVFGAKQSLHMNYLPEAEKRGMRVFGCTEALNIQTLGEGANSSSGHLIPRYEVTCRKSDTGEEMTFLTHLLILGSGTIGTAALLMRSRRYLPLLSEEVGRNITVNGSVKSAGLLPDGFPEGDMYTGRSHPGMISYALLASEGITVSCAKPLPLDLIATARLVRKGRAGSNDYWGREHVRLMRQYRRRGIVLYTLGIAPHTAELTLNGDGSVSPKMTVDDSLRRYHERVTRILHSIFERNRCTILDPQFIDGTGRVYEDIHLSTAHMMGSCRMADRSENGVTDQHGEVFGYPGLFVTDGAAIPSSLAVNPSLTILANAERIGEYLASRYGTGV